MLNALLSLAMTLVFMTTALTFSALPFYLHWDWEHLSKATKLLCLVAPTWWLALFGSPLFFWGILRCLAKKQIGPASVLISVVLFMLAALLFILQELVRGHSVALDEPPISKTRILFNAILMAGLIAFAVWQHLTHRKKES